MDTESKSERPFVSQVYEIALCPLTSELCYSLVTEDCTDLSNLWAVSGFISATGGLTQVCDEHIYGQGSPQTPGIKLARTSIFADLCENNAGFLFEHISRGDAIHVEAAKARQAFEEINY